MLSKTTDKNTLLKEQRFKRVASRRVKEILNKLRLLGNCANRNNYCYRQEQANKIISIIDLEWKKEKLEFKASESKREEFTL